MKTFVLLISLIISLETCGEITKTKTSSTNIADNQIAFRRNATIGRGINFGNALEAPTEGEWGLTIKESYVQAVADAGFNSVRLPICWSAHTSHSAPYAINSTFLNRIDTVVNWCTRRGMLVIITIHHFNDFYDQPDNETYKSMFNSIWQQLSTHYKNFDHEKLLFEILNEPHGNMTADKWNLLIPPILETIRKIDTDRTLIIDVPDYGYHESISKLNIPKSETNTIISVRYYLPYPFTHQGAHWAEGSDKWLGTTWTATQEQKNTVETDMQKIQTWANQNNRPVTIGEFGSIIYADASNRLIWTDYVTRSFESHNFSWNYFDFGVIFKAYDIEKDCWLKGFPEALIHQTTSFNAVDSPNRVFPIPTSKKLNIDSENIVSVKLISIDGKERFNSEIVSNQIDLSGFKSGVYVVEMKDKQGKISSQKILVSSLF
jgi:endoglucanase